MTFRLLLFVLLAYALYRFLRWMRKSNASGSQEGEGGGGAVDEMVQDPVCEIYVPRRDSVKRVIRGKTFFFCSEKCASRFEVERKGVA